MVFIGKDWRAPGDLWVRVNHVNHTAGWELIKLRPIQLDSFPRGNSTASLLSETPTESPPLAVDEQVEASDGILLLPKEQPQSEEFPPLPSTTPFKRKNNSGSAATFSLSLSESDILEASPPPVSVESAGGGGSGGGTSSSEEQETGNEDEDDEEEDEDGEGGGEREEEEEEAEEETTLQHKHLLQNKLHKQQKQQLYNSWLQPYCFVKLKNRSKEFIGCTSMSEAFHRLDLARAVVDIRRFNYICKVVQILVNEKLQNLSASSRKILFAIIQAMVLNSVENDVQVSTTKDILSKFNSGLDSPHVCGSPQLVSRQQGTCSNLLDLIARSSAPHTLSEANPDSVTFLDLPREVLSLILSKLPDHVSLLEAAKANETLEALVESEQRQWKTLCQFHFSQVQIDKHQCAEQSWRALFFELKKYYGLRETYADLIVVCCHCKALFWKDHGHPCVSKDSPFVRVTPKQFVDMLLFL